MMMWTDVRTHWRPLGPQIQSKWARLTEEDIDAVGGRRTELIALLQERYGFDSSEAIDEVDIFVRSLQVISL